MNATDKISDSVESILHSSGNVIEFVDALLKVCQEQRLHVRWQTDGCRIRSLRGGRQEQIAESLPKARFRAILARVAALCNDHSPDSISPYGGQGTLALASDRKPAIRVLFANTPDEQWLDLRPLPP